MMFVKSAIIASVCITKVFGSAGHGGTPPPVHEPDDASSVGSRTPSFKDDPPKGRDLTDTKRMGQTLAFRDVRSNTPERGIVMPKNAPDVFSTTSTIVSDATRPDGEPDHLPPTEDPESSTSQPPDEKDDQPSTGSSGTPQIPDELQLPRYYSKAYDGDNEYENELKNTWQSLNLGPF